MNSSKEMLNWLSHRVYQMKKTKNRQIYEMFGIFGIISEKIINNKSGNHNNLCLLVLAWTAPRSSKQQPKIFLVHVYWSARDVFVLVTVLQFWIVKKLSKNAILHYISGNFHEVLPDVSVFLKFYSCGLTRLNF